MTTKPLPPLPDHVGRVTPSGVFTFVGLSLIGGGKVYAADQMHGYAQQARADLEAENARLREALTLTFSHLVEHIDRWDDELLECKKTVKAVTGKQL